MILMFELDQPCQLKPWFYRSDVMYRIVWLWFGVAFFKRDMRYLCENTRFESLPRARSGGEQPPTQQGTQETLDTKE